MKKTLQILLLTGLFTQSIQMRAQFAYVRDFFAHSNASFCAMGLAGMGIAYFCIERLLTKFAAHCAGKVGINAGFFEGNQWAQGGAGLTNNGFNQMQFLFKVTENKEKILDFTGGFLAYNYLIRKTESALYSQSDFGKAQKGMSSKLTEGIKNPLSVKNIQNFCDCNTSNHGTSNFRIDMLLYRSANGDKNNIISNTKSLQVLKNDSIHLRDEAKQAFDILSQCNEIKLLQLT